MENDANDKNKEPVKAEPEKDSFGMDVKKSPWMIFALLQIPIVIIMIIFIYVMSQQAGNN